MRNFNDDRGFKNFSDRSFGGNRGGSRGGSSFGGNRGGFGGNRNDRPMYDAVCDKCGQNCQVPFQPTGEKPVYCSNCFEKTSGREGGSERSFGGNRDFGGNSRKFEQRDTKSYQQDNTRTEIEALSKKVDRIIELLTVKKTVPEAALRQAQDKKVKKVKKVEKIETPTETQE
jgi:CxxC-x17-CxxC domain-containing protein